MSCEQIANEMRVCAKVRGALCAQIPMMNDGRHLMKSDLMKSELTKIELTKSGTNQIEENFDGIVKDQKSRVSYFRDDSKNSRSRRTHNGRL
jgi:hypothetical protein